MFVSDRGRGTMEIGLFESFPAHPLPGRHPSRPTPDWNGVDHQTIARKVPLCELPFAGQFSGWSRQTLLKLRLSEHLEHSPFPLGKPPPINTSAPFPAERNRSAPLYRCRSESEG